MAIAFVQQTTFINPNVGFNTAAQTAGNVNFIEVLVAGTATAPTGVGDTKNGAYTLVTSTGGTTEKLYLYSFFNIAAATAGANQLTLTNPTGSTRVVYVGHEFSGVANTQDSASPTTGSATSAASSAPMTTTNANDLLLSMMAVNTTGTITSGSGYTNLWIDNGTVPSASAQYQIAAATGTYNGNFTNPSQLWIALQVAFQASTGGSVQVNQSGQMLISATQAAAQGIIATPITTGIMGMTGRAIVQGGTPPPSGPVTVASNPWWWMYNGNMMK